ncbi:3D domain-containing protein [Paenibacillus cymbidii]|uniref:3D domain-containing protein n=1 Tax=Paenibacillus cymbidii TaxID=1639034 RepID=UPI00108092CE|nr:3D domain-containing protein [Paenibacillus cymbidii]
MKWQFRSGKKALLGLVLTLSVSAFTIPAYAAGAAPGNYVTNSTDTFWKISQKLNLDLNALMAANPSVNPYNMYAGLTLRLPTAAATAATAVAPNTVHTGSGQTLAYSKALDIVATAYDDSMEDNGGWGAYDYFGNPLKVGTIAVDPKVIPLGTKVYVTGIRFDGMPQAMVATANDIGGAIKGNRIDIFIPGAYGNIDDFGFQNVKVYVLTGAQ